MVQRFWGNGAVMLQTEMFSPRTEAIPYISQNSRVWQIPLNWPSSIPEHDTNCGVKFEVRLPEISITLNNNNR